MQPKLLISVVHLCVFQNQDFPLKASHVCNSWQFWLAGMRATCVHTHKEKWLRITLFHSCEIKLTLQAFKRSKTKILFSWLDFKMVSMSFNLIFLSKNTLFVNPVTIIWLVHNIWLHNIYNASVCQLKSRHDLENKVNATQTLIIIQVKVKVNVMLLHMNSNKN